MANIQKRPDGRWRARYRDEAGREHAKHFTRKLDAQRWIDEVTTSIVIGQYVDPRAGKITFKEYAEHWRAAQVHRPTSEAYVEGVLRRHVYPIFGARPIGSVLPSEVQAWVKLLGTGDRAAKRKPLAPATVGVIHGVVSGIFRSAIRDRRIMANPCEGTRLPRVERRRVMPLTTSQVETLREHLPDDLKALVTFAAGTGMRQGEIFGLTRNRLRLLGTNPVVVVDRQLLTRLNRVTEFGPLKTRASYRTIPLPVTVVDALNGHLAARDIGDDDLIFTLDGRPITRQAFGHLWRPVAKVAGLNQATGPGMHALRHYYASLLIRYGESVKTVQARLGHASASETLDTYSHLWPDSDDRTREAIDSVLGRHQASGVEVPGA
ncbi:tyrosine-type recombinase/integrase [Nocardioides renjunii]|uniref:tyrosine-type recombinase/integrase n=1 Tax=Nocardioides renjunii TaxID=3095075 RepID=UPI002B001709|nr:tyrosine-type recombinase/integrase [Nocardioides sp. S-34]WQQ23872.1 tyrosine-type recombinase/integrase [Nocardioides sp. S-34]